MSNELPRITRPGPPIDIGKSVFPPATTVVRPPSKPAPAAPAPSKKG